MAMQTAEERLGVTSKMGKPLSGWKAIATHGMELSHTSSKSHVPQPTATSRLGNLSIQPARGLKENHIIRHISVFQKKKRCLTRPLPIPHICHGSHGCTRVNFFGRCKFLPIQREKLAFSTDFTQKIGVFLQI